MVQNLVIGFILFLVIHGYLLATRGQTVGKTLLKIRIVRSDGSPASPGAHHRPALPDDRRALVDPGGRHDLRVWSTGC